MFPLIRPVSHILREIRFADLHQDCGFFWSRWWLIDGATAVADRRITMGTSSVKGFIKGGVYSISPTRFIRREEVVPWAYKSRWVNCLLYVSGIQFRVSHIFREEIRLRMLYRRLRFLQLKSSGGGVFQILVFIPAVTFVTDVNSFNFIKFIACSVWTWRDANLVGMSPSWNLARSRLSSSRWIAYACGTASSVLSSGYVVCEPVRGASHYHRFEPMRRGFFNVVDSRAVEIVAECKFTQGTLPKRSLYLPSRMVKYCRRNVEITTGQHQYRGAAYTIPTTNQNAPTRKDNFVSIRVNNNAYKERISLCQFSLIARVVLTKGDKPWKHDELYKL
ncbi:hypothetical protein FNV43_RR13260 [Rhamnella rubrinervis]|uniref:Uncharacterized protein n=1 Tax=Rhamnella rubrinervis TaxID=2594499 RepID=A0A8K0MF36_9ROSA|nr:hypothetical protein FNV43_RR13260 [Rhamnella rubrinervis]